MAHRQYPSALIEVSHLATQGAAAPFAGGHLISALRSERDWRSAGDTTGVVHDRVMSKGGPTAPEVPFANGRVWSLRLTDGYKAWEGWSNAQGWYRAEGLEAGVEYVAVGIDPERHYKATGAGPVRAKASVEGTGGTP